MKKDLEKNGWYVVRQGKSAFPDLICIKKPDESWESIPREFAEVKFVECKMNKYLSKEEKEKIEELKKMALCFVAWKPGRGKIEYYEV